MIGLRKISTKVDTYHLHRIESGEMSHILTASLSIYQCDTVHQPGSLLLHKDYYMHTHKHYLSSTTKGGKTFVKYAQIIQILFSSATIVKGNTALKILKILIRAIALST